MASRKVVLKGTGIRNEANAGGAITPGHLLALTSTGTVIVHGVHAGTAAAIFAVEEDFLGTGKDDAYASGDVVQYDALHAGQQVHALVNGGAPAITSGDYLTSAGDGTLRAITTGSPVGLDEAVVGVAKESVDNSSASADARIVVEIV